MLPEPGERGMYPRKNFSHLGLLTQEDLSVFYISENTSINTGKGGHTTCNWKCKLQCNLIFGFTASSSKTIISPSKR